MSKSDDNKTNQQLVSLICAISLDPKSWGNWKCLDVSIEIPEDSETSEVSLMCAKSLLESYLRDKDMHIFVCPPHSLYALVKNVDPITLAEAADFIKEMIQEENARDLIQCQMYDLVQDADAFLSKVQEQGDVGPLRMASGSARNIIDFPLHPDTKALLVEDDPVTRWMVRSTLKDSCHLATASTASAAYAMYSAFRPDVVFLDIGLPDKSGTDVLEWILRNDPGARIVMFSSQDSLDHILGTIESGAIGFIAKPFKRESLLHYLRLASLKSGEEIHV